MKTKKWFAMALACMMAVGSFAGCSSSETTSTADDGSSVAEDESSASDSSAEENTGLTGDIHVLSREDGSGTVLFERIFQSLENQGFIVHKQNFFRHIHSPFPSTERMPRHALNITLL